MKILVTGFDPFGTDSINPSIEAVKKLPDTIDGAKIIKREIPTVFHKSADVVREAILAEKPDYILNIGQAGGRTDLTPERIAINLDDARIEDNEGQQPIDQPIKNDGDAAYFSQLPIKGMVDYMKKEGLPASVSNSAGTFVCNHIMYQTLYLTANEFPEIKAGFMHIPFMTEQVVDRAEKPSLSLDNIIKGIEASIKAIVAFDGKKDLKVIGGKIH